MKTITSTPLKTFTPTPIPTLGTTPSPAPASTPAPAKTWAQYNRYCSGCHGTSYQGASAALIQTGINIIPDMSSLKTLTAAQIAAIAAGQ
jgi:mono/diheme cytochrome c family protein